MTNNFTPAKAGQQSKRLSKEEYAEKMKAEKEAVYQMADDTAKAIVSDPEKFKAFLDTQSRLDRYSAVNALLIFKQLPEASQLKNFDDWSKDNVKIQKGAKSISILEPVEYAKKDGTTGISYNVKKVFDVSQTNGKRPPAPTVNRDPKALITVMLDSSPVEVEATNELPYPNMAAFYNNEEQTLYVKRDVGDSVAVAQCVAQSLATHSSLSTATVTAERIWAFRQYVSAICFAKSTASIHRILLSTVSLKSSPAKSRRTFAMSFPKRETQWRIFTPVFPMSFTRKSRNEAKTTKDKVRLWRRKKCIISHWTIMNTALLSVLSTTRKQI